MKGLQRISNRHEDFDYYDDDDLDIERGYIVIAEGLAWGPFELPTQALSFALKTQPNMLFKLTVLMSPALLLD